MTLQEIERQAAQSGACFLALRSGGKLPERLRGSSSGEGWLYAARGTDRRMICAAVSRFNKVRIFYQEGGENAGGRHPVGKGVLK